MKYGRLNIIIGSIVIVAGGIGGFLLGGTLDSFVKDGVYNITLVRIFMRGSHTHGLLMAFYNLIFGLMVDSLALSGKAKRAGSIIAACSLLLPVGLGLRGMTDGSMAFAPISLVGGVLFIASSVFILIGAIRKKA